MLKNILIICVGNICRSPVGELLFTHRFSQNELDVSVSSAGLGALKEYPADPIVQELMQEKGLDLSTHRARQLSSELVFDADLILTMTSDQKKHIEAKYPSARGRVHRLGEWAGYDIPDPFKRPKQVFEQVVAMIEQGVEDWYQKFWSK